MSEDKETNDYGDTLEELTAMYIELLEVYMPLRLYMISILDEHPGISITEAGLLDEFTINKRMSLVPVWETVTDELGVERVVFNLEPTDAINDEDDEGKVINELYSWRDEQEDE